MPGPRPPGDLQKPERSHKSNDVTQRRFLTTVYCVCRCHAQRGNRLHFAPRNEAGLMLVVADRKSASITGSQKPPNVRGHARTSMDQRKQQGKKPSAACRKCSHCGCPHEARQVFSHIRTTAKNSSRLGLKVSAFPTLCYTAGTESLTATDATAQPAFGCRCSSRDLRFDYRGCCAYRSCTICNRVPKRDSKLKTHCWRPSPVRLEPNCHTQLIDPSWRQSAWGPQQSSLCPLRPSHETTSCKAPAME